MTSERVFPSSFAQGFALCSPEGTLLPHSFRRTKAEAIASVFTDAENRDVHWAAAEQQGMTIEFVYARVFQPRFFASSVLAAMAEKEMAGAAKDGSPAIFASLAYSSVSAGAAVCCRNAVEGYSNNLRKSHFLASEPQRRFAIITNNKLNMTETLLKRGILQLIFAMWPPCPENGSRYQMVQKFRVQAIRDVRLPDVCAVTVFHRIFSERFCVYCSTLCQRRDLLGRRQKVNLLLKNASVKFADFIGLFRRCGADIIFAPKPTKKDHFSNPHPFDCYTIASVRLRDKSFEKGELA